jgi:competence protein ComEA
MNDSLFFHFLRQHWLPVGIFLFGLIFLGYGLISFSGQKPSETAMTFDAAKDEGTATSQKGKQSATGKQITVDVEGSVQKPGVYQLPVDSRVQDALIAAGGMNDKADRTSVAKNLNMAAKLTDGAKLYIPMPGEISSAYASAGEGGQSVLGAANGAQINLNTASAKELDDLPGVGEVTSAKIIAGRPYGAVEELLQKKIVSQKVFEEIKGKVSVN